MPLGASKSFEEPSCEVWECNWKTLKLFAALSTQWRIGTNGATGLDYCALSVVARVLRVRLSPSRLDGIRAMEGEVLRLMGEKSSRDAKQ
ncbi:MAG: DUF1799 domain-containing protein [Sulfurisoma sp.]|nr:DUF1799 domain-containing protein [Sulfurisoma sp.]